MKTDKGNSLVVMNRSSYSIRIHEFLTSSNAIPDPKQIDIYPNNVPMFPHYSTVEERLKSFENWTGKLPPTLLALAGFVSTQSTDRTYCYQCGGTLHNWEDSDDPITAHTLWFPKC